MRKLSQDIYWLIRIPYVAISGPRLFLLPASTHTQNIPGRHTGPPQLQKGAKAKCSTAAFPKLFAFREVGTQVSLVTMSRPSPRTAAPPPCLPLDIKVSLKGDRRFFDGGWNCWLTGGLKYGIVQVWWDSASLSTKTLRKLKREHGTVQV
jgi:hypothetical protein